MRTWIVASLAAALIASSTPAVAGIGFIPSGAGGSHWSWGLLRLPLLSFHMRAKAKKEAESAPQEQALVSSQDWRTVGFAMPMRGRGCYVKIAGTAEFDRAEVVFADGELRALDLGGARRGKGLYELMMWDEPREIACVRMRVRACSGRARLQLLLRD